jgi:hypothetical protein
MREYSLIASVTFIHAGTAIDSDLSKVDLIPYILILLHPYSNCKIHNNSKKRAFISNNTHLSGTASGL